MCVALSLLGFGLMCAVLLRCVAFAVRCVGVCWLWCCGWCVLSCYVMCHLVWFVVCGVCVI